MSIPSPSAPSKTVQRRISNTEVNSWLACRRQYYYAYGMSLEPKKPSAYLTKGILFHLALEGFYTGLKDGLDVEGAVNRGTNSLLPYVSDPMTLESALQAQLLYVNYCAHYAETDNAQWTILAVEQTQDLPLNDEFSMPFKFDLLVKERASGKVGLVDHKTTYDFWSPDAHALNGQFPKYLGAMRGNGFKIDFCMLNEVRTRQLKDKSPVGLFKRTRYTPSEAKVKQALFEHIIASREITSFRAQPLETQDKLGLRTLNTQLCKFCPMKSLCISEFDGGDITFLKVADYQPNSYNEGYNPSDSEPEGEM